MRRRGRFVASSASSNGVADSFSNGCPNWWVGHPDLELKQRDFLLGVGRVERLSWNIGLTESDSRRYIDFHVDVYWGRWFCLRQRNCDRMERARACSLRGSNQHPDQQLGGIDVVVTECECLHRC